ncbi:MAG TPA: hypothetical protein VG497_26595, partial [Kribbella sp.]|nr:hypothetical protein [Kribbella sp.]
HDQVVQLVNHGADHAPVAEPEGVEPAGDPHYNRLAYANHAGPDLSDQEPGIDNLISLVSPDGVASGRGRIRRLGVEGRTASSWHKAWLGPEGPWAIEVTSVVWNGWELRCALVEGPQGATVRSAGFAVAGASLPEATSTDNTDGTAAPAGSVRNVDGLLSAVVGLYGYEAAGVHRAVGVNPFGVHSATPYLTAQHHGEPLVLVNAVLLTRDALRPEALAEGIDVRVDGTAVRIGLPGGDTEVVELGQSRLTE